jgi:tetratricopeptide (TPR) repeat protein
MTLWMHRQVFGATVATVLALLVAQTATVGDMGQGLVANAAPAKASGAFAQGQAYYAKGWLVKAIAAYRTAIKQQPNNPAVYAALGNALKKQGGKANLAEATQAFDRSLRLDPKQPDTLNALAELLGWQVEKRDVAIGLYKDSLALKPNQPEVTKQVAQLLYWQGNYAEALPYARQVAYSKDPTFLTAYAGLLNATRNYDEALQIYTQRLNAPQSKDFAVRQGYAVALLKTGNVSQARGLYDSLAKTADKKKPDVTAAMAGLAYELGYYDEVLNWDKLSPDQNSVGVRIRKARSFAKLNRAPEAVDTFYRLYQDGLLTPAEHVEFADYLVDSQLVPSALPQPNLIETLYKQALAANVTPAETALKLARHLATDPTRFKDAVNFYTYVLEQGELGAGSPAQVAVSEEVTGYLKSYASQPGYREDALARFGDLGQRFSGNYVVLEGMADVLAWETGTRTDALRLYASLLQEFPQQAERLATGVGTLNGATQQVHVGMNKVLDWHPAKVELMPVYQSILAVSPDNYHATWAIARATWQDGENYAEALALYDDLLAANPDDDALLKDYGYLLGSVPQGAERRKALKKLAELRKQHPERTTVQLAYANLLSYSGYYDKAVTEYNDLISKEPSNREALSGRSLAYLWSGQKFKAVDELKRLQGLYPDDPQLALSMAKAYKAMGRYDKVLEIVRDLKTVGTLQENTIPLPPPMDESLAPAPGSLAPMQDRIAPASSTNLLPPPTEADPADPLYGSTALPVDEAAPSLAFTVVDAVAGKQAGSSAGQAAQGQSQQSVEGVTAQAPADTPAPVLVALGETRNTADVPPQVGKELELLEDSLKALEALQGQSQQQLTQLEQAVKQSQAASAIGSPQASTLTLVRQSQPAGEAMGLPITAPPSMMQQGAGQMAQANWQLGDEAGYGDEAAPSFAQQLGTNTAAANPLLANQFWNDDNLATLSTLEKETRIILRPTFRTGFLYSTQEGDDSTNALRSWAFPNNVSLSLHPRVRVRGGYAYKRFSLPDTGIDPRATNANQYSFGSTIKLADRLTFDGDIGITQFDQTDNTNITYQARLITDIHDKVRWTIGGHRLPYETSLLSYAGLRPGAGALAGQVIGQARENAVFTEFNLGPWKNWDLNLGYQFALITQEEPDNSLVGRAGQALGTDLLPSNFMNQAYANLGYTHRYLQQHSARLGYEFLYFGFDKNATNGFVDLVNGSARPVSSLRPVTPAATGVIYGGYFSPESFFLNSARLDLKGYFKGRLFEYDLGGAVGVQHFDSGITGEGSDTSLAYRLNARLTANLTDWLSLYGVTEYLDSGGFFSRWRFGAGLIVRPKIDAISPVFGKYR